MPAYDVNGTTMAVSERGDGGTIPLVLLHAFPVDRRMWDAQLTALSNRFRVIAPDFRGFGQSADAANGTFTIETLADDVHELLGTFGATPAVVAGCSMGGYVALALAAKYPADLKGLILVDTKAEADTGEAREGRQKMIELVRKSGAAGIAEQMLPKMLAKDAAEKRPNVAKRLRELMESCPPETIAHALAAMRDRPDRSGELAAIQVPTLILVGDGDQVTPPKVAEAMHAKIAGSTLTVISGAGHMTPMEQPELVNRAIREFAEKL
jgi:pimeloyl-ACP methyl ester carboxylesterase